MSDPYRTLGLSPGASEADVKAAFRRLALQYHPDRQVGASASAKAEAAKVFTEVAAAFEFLSDPARRVRFERSRASRAGPAGNAGYYQYGSGGGGGASYSYAYDGPTHETWRRTDMGGAATGAAADSGPWVLRSLRRSLSGVAVGGLVLALLTVNSFSRGSSTNDGGRDGSGAGPRGGEASYRMPTPDRLTRQQAEAFGLPYRPPRMQPRSAAADEWAKQQIDSADKAAAAAQSAATAAAVAAANAAESARRAAAAAARSRTARTPGQIAAASVAARSEAETGAKYATAAELLATGAQQAAEGKGVLSSGASALVAALEAPEQSRRRGVRPVAGVRVEPEAPPSALPAGRSGADVG